MDSTFQQVRKQILEFRKQREWLQFHDPKNLAEGLVIESAELLENFLWKRCEETHDMDDTDIQRIADELADILIYLVYLSDSFDLDLIEETRRKIIENARKYPIEKSKGSRKKYTDL